MSFLRLQHAKNSSTPGKETQRERDYRSFFYYSPFVKGMPKEAPARLGYFIGYKIIDSYMKNNRVSINELMLENDYSYL